MDEDFFGIAPQTPDEEFQKLYGEERLHQLLFVREFRSCLYPHEQVIFDLRLAEQMTIQEISEKFKVSRPYVATVTKNIIQKCNESYRLFLMGDPCWQLSVRRLPLGNGRASGTAQRLAEGWITYQRSKDAFAGLAGLSC